MEYTLEKANQMAVALRALPAIDDSKRKLDKQGMVRHLADEIVALQKRGYTIEQVVESLTKAGLDITTPTLKSYLQRIKKKTRRSQKVTSPKDGIAGPAGGAGGTKSEFIGSDRERL